MMTWQIKGVEHVYLREECQKE